MKLKYIVFIKFIIYTNKYVKSCDRPCHEFDWPMICRYKLTLETYKTDDSSCNHCFQNSTSCSDETCLFVDGNNRGALLINRRLPGPMMRICQNDILVIDVLNRIPGQSLSIHWRGQHQIETPFMDGVPMVTQCPISSYTTFQYRFRASTPGTHIYHSHSGSETADGIFGALIVRQSDRMDAQRKLYDIDSGDHVILISEWAKVLSTDPLDETDVPNSLLINGKSKGQEFHIKQGKRYRFRVAYTGGVSNCPISMKIERHFMKIIALDGNPSYSYEASSIVFGKGERVDFVLNTKQDVGDYGLVVKSTCNESLWTSALIRYSSKYNGDISTRKTSASDSGEEVPGRIFTTNVCHSILGNVCISDVHALKKMPKVLGVHDVDRKIYLPFDYKISPNQKQNGIAASDKIIYTIDNITFTYPSSPLLTQSQDLQDGLLCDNLSKLNQCGEENFCECVHVENISLGASVELILTDQGGSADEHVFHLHGYSFYVVGTRNFENHVPFDEIKSLDERGQLFRRNLLNAALKDTIRIPKYGVVALRFIANNPGFWMLRDENSNQWTRGMDIVLKVGEERDFIWPPNSFPSCGSWIGPEFFLA